MAINKQDRAVEERVTLVKNNTANADNRFLEEQSSGQPPVAATETRVVYFAPKPQQTLSQISEANKAKASEAEKVKVEEISKKEEALNTQGSKGFDNLEDLAKFNKDREALEKEKTSIPFAAVAPPQTTIDPVPEIATSSTQNIPVQMYNSQASKHIELQNKVNEQLAEYDSTYKTFEQEYKKVETNYNTQNKAFENAYKLFLAEASGRPVVKEDTYIWSKYQDLLSKEAELNKTVNELNKQGTMLNNFSSSNLSEIIPKVNNLNKTSAYLIAQSKRYPSTPESASKLVEASAEAEKKVEAASGKLTPKQQLKAPEIKLIDKLALAEKKVEQSAQSKPLTGVPVVDASLENPIGSYAPKTSSEALELEKKLLESSKGLPKPYNAETFETWNKVQQKSEWNTTKEALLAYGAKPEQIKALESVAGDNYDAVLYSVDGKGNFMLPTSKKWNEIELIPKEDIRKEIDKIKEGLQPASALDMFKAQVAGSIATKAQKQKYFDSLSNKKQEELSAIIFADEELQKEALDRNKAVTASFASIKETATNLYNVAAGDKKSADKNAIELGKDIASVIDKGLQKIVPQLNGYRENNPSLAPAVPTVGENNNIVLNYLSKIPDSVNKLNENFSSYLQGSKKAEWEAYYNKYNGMTLDIKAYVKQNTAKEKVYEEVKEAQEKNQPYSKELSAALKSYIEKRDNQEKKLLAYESNLFNSVSSSPLDLIPQSAKQALNNSSEAILDFVSSYRGGSIKEGTNNVISKVTIPYKELDNYWQGKNDELKSYVTSGALAIGNKANDIFFANSDDYVWVDKSKATAEQLASVKETNRKTDRVLVLKKGKTQFIASPKGEQFPMFDGLGGTVAQGINIIAGNQLRNTKPYLLEKTSRAINTGWNYMSFLGADSERQGFKMAFDKDGTPVMTEGFYKLAADPKNITELEIGKSKVGINALDALFLLVPMTTAKQGATVSAKALTKSLFSNKSTKNIVNNVLPNISKNEYKDFLTVLSRLDPADRKKAMELRALADSTGKTTELGAYYINKPTGRMVNELDLNTPANTGGWVRQGITYDPKTTELKITKATEWSEKDLAAIGGYSLKNIRKMQIGNYLKWLDDAKNKGDISASDYVQSQAHIQYLLKGLFDSLKDINKDPSKFKSISDGLVKEYFKKIIARAESYKLGKTKKGKFEWNSQELDELWRNYLGKNLKRSESGNIDPLLRGLDNTGNQNPQFNTSKIFDELDDYFKNNKSFDDFYNTTKPPQPNKPAAPASARTPAETAKGSQAVKVSETGKEASQASKPATQTAQEFSKSPPSTTTATKAVTANFDNIFSPKALQSTQIAKIPAIGSDTPSSFLDWIANTKFKRGYSQTLDNKLVQSALKEMDSNPLITPLTKTKALEDYKDINKDIVTRFRLENNVTRDLDKQFTDAVSIGSKTPAAIGVGSGSFMDMSPSGKSTSVPKGGKSADIVMTPSTTQTPQAVPTQTKLKSITTTKVPNTTKSKINIPTRLDQNITVRDGVVTSTPTKTATKTATATATKTATKTTTTTGRKPSTKPTKPTRKLKLPFIPIILPNKGGTDTESSLVDEKIYPKVVSWRQGQVYPKVDLEKQTVKFGKKRPPKLRRGKTPNETFTVLKAKKYIPKNKKLSLGRVDANIKPNGIAFSLKRKEVLSLPNFLKRNKYLKKLK